MWTEYLKRTTTILLYSIHLLRVPNNLHSTVKVTEPTIPFHLLSGPRSCLSYPSRDGEWPTYWSPFGGTDRHDIKERTTLLVLLPR